jgi:hypothetical protein
VDHQATLSLGYCIPGDGNCGLQMLSGKLEMFYPVMIQYFVVVEQCAVA